MGKNRYRSGRKKGYVVLYREAAQDVRLSLEARGLFAMMISLPENWDYSVAGLSKKAGCGKDKIRRLLGELQEVGYLVREQAHDPGGKFAGNIYVLQDEAPPLYGNPDNGEQAETAPLSGNTDNGENRQRENPLSVIPTQKNKELKEEEKEKNPHTPQRGARASKYDLQDDAKPVLRAYVGEDQVLARALADLIDLRRDLHAINSRRAIVALLAELDKLSGGRREDKLRLLQQSIVNSWKSVYPLRGSDTRNSAPLPEVRYGLR